MARPVRQSEPAWRMLEFYESRVRALQEALKAGEDSSAAISFDAASFLERMQASHAR